jgi:hypothetical protein
MVALTIAWVIVIAFAVMGLYLRWAALHRPRCSRCNNEIDPERCWCGARTEDHGWINDHPFVPAGCDCLRDESDDENHELW